MQDLLLDTNGLISYTTTRNSLQAGRIAPFIEGAGKLQYRLYIVSNVITEYVHVMRSIYDADAVWISKLIQDLWAHPGIEYHHGYFPERILTLWPRRIKDYGDAVLAAAVTEMEVPVLTFDRDFAARMKRLHLPCELLH